jgi:hypothetical protein
MVISNPRSFVSYKRSSGRFESLEYVSNSLKHVHIAVLDVLNHHNMFPNSLKHVHIAN